MSGRIFTSFDTAIAREIDGSGVRQFSQFNTTDFIVTRQYIQRADVYKPLPLSVADPYFRNAYLVEEVEDRRALGHVWFRRTYATIPSSRTERQEMVFTFPGRSALISTRVEGELVRRWDRYGRAKPATVWREAAVRYTYSLGEPSTGLPTQVTFEDQPVDFVGSVYTEDGETFLGNTSPLSAPTTFVISDVAKRWRGNIWERVRVSVSLNGGAAVIGS